jgi:hypothetical protein
LGKEALPIRVWTTGMSDFSTSRRSACTPPQWYTPPPATTRGRWAPLSSAAARLTWPGCPSRVGL